MKFISVFSDGGSLPGSRCVARPKVFEACLKQA
jgi:hypothetical protein